MIIKPPYQLISQSETAFSLECDFRGDYPYFAGHFPSFALLAGVVQLGLVHQFVQQFFALSLSQATIRQIKYQQPILPESKVLLSVQYYPEQKRLDFKWQQAEKVMSSGIFILKSE
ncbi:hypothetical protein ACFFHK_04835 [Gallibacterium trehalosifermentans]|uniref:ApeI dehydratase-like domain-containing protein n=1 Tax=Gallibacterium trehalosifermentans TaxID=516935 RepID=A0ABV6H144_9PAST